MKKLLVFALLAAGIWWWQHDEPAKWRGFPAAKDPVQGSGGLPPSFQSGKFRISPLATYSITAVVLSRERYRFDPVAPLAPVDLALGWGPMSVAGTINELKISQSGRWYEYSWAGDAPLETDDIIKHSANTHCLPANDAVRRELLAVKRHDLVTLQGYLVEVNGSDGGKWRSSLTRDDKGGGACEILWITGVTSKKL